jgi:hypothetical protein
MIVPNKIFTDVDYNNIVYYTILGYNRIMNDYDEYHIISIRHNFGIIMSAILNTMEYYEEFPDITDRDKYNHNVCNMEKYYRMLIFEYSINGQLDNNYITALMASYIYWYKQSGKQFIELDIVLNQ